VAGPPGPPGAAPSFSPQRMMMMFRQPDNKGYQGDDPKIAEEVVKLIDSKILFIFSGRAVQCRSLLI